MDVGESVLNETLHISESAATGRGKGPERVSLPGAGAVSIRRRGGLSVAGTELAGGDGAAAWTFSVVANKQDHELSARVLELADGRPEVGGEGRGSRAWRVYYLIVRE